MLQKLSINNYAIIDRLSITPAKGLNIVTGETGAGKSIILGALSLILGDRADSSVLINKDEKCVVEAVFDVKDNEHFRAALAEEELDDEPQCIIRREINTAGKSRAFINDTPVRLDVLNKLTSLLVDLHQQFDHLALDNSNFQADVLDAVAETMPLRKEYSTHFQQYKKLSKKLNELLQQKQDWQKEADYKKFLLDELSDAAFKDNEIEDADAQLKQLANAERITSTLQESLHVLDTGDSPIAGEIKRILQQLDGLRDMMPAVKDIAARLNSVHIELKDIISELETAADKVVIDEERMQQLQERIDIGYKLLKKHAVHDTSGLLALQQQLENDLQASLNLDDEIKVAEADKDKAYKQLMSVAEKISAARRKAAPAFSKEVNKLLSLVGMPNALFVAEVQSRETPGDYGIDDIQFFLDANKSGKLQPVYKAASGGEMSRIMLSIKSLTAKAMELPTLIFDEVDTGVSGEVAKQVGVLLRDLAQYHQVICITHQPQVAAKGNCHMYVYKEPTADGKRITTRVNILSDDERIVEIAKMIGGEQPGEAAMQNARELVAS